MYYSSWYKLAKMRVYAQQRVILAPSIGHCILIECKTMFDNTIASLTNNIVAIRSASIGTSGILLMKQPPNLSSAPITGVVVCGVLFGVAPCRTREPCIPLPALFYHITFSVASLLVYMI